MGNNRYNEISVSHIIKIKHGSCSHTDFHIRMVHGCREPFGRALSASLWPLTILISLDMQICIGALTLFYLYIKFNMQQDLTIIGVGWTVSIDGDWRELSRELGGFTVRFCWMPIQLSGRLVSLQHAHSWVDGHHAVLEVLGHVLSWLQGLTIRCLPNHSGHMTREVTIVPHLCNEDDIAKVK